MTIADAADWFAGRKMVLATMHRKEEVIAPLLESRLNVQVTVPPNFDTDAFGTFTGDIRRPADQLTTARLKATAALQQTDETLAIASEGSFGPHPHMPFVACDRELVVLLDQQHQLEIVGEALSTETNYCRQTVHSVEAALAFADSIGFPAHGVVVRPVDKAGNTTSIVKGITQVDPLVAAVRIALAQSPDLAVLIETDMRALYNPTRMQVIAEATKNLLQTIAQCCPGCGCPGLSGVERLPGLPCRWCQTPTLLTRSVLYQCQRCQWQQSRPVPEADADPRYCPYCNP